ncbi:MAG: beta-L-arabinofuranosidase domain-containing protein, partial [Phocaeicola sp.]
MSLFQILFSTSVAAQLPLKIEPFPINQVRLTPSPFQRAQLMDVSYLLGLNADRLLAPYLKEAGLSPKAPNYTNWEDTGLDGHIGGHYLSALSYMYGATGDVRMKERLEYVLGELKRCQEAVGTGYLCGVPGGKRIFSEIKAGNITASGFGLNGGWVPLYNIHKIYAGLRDAYLQAGEEEAKDMLIKLTDWMLDVVAHLSDEQIQEMLQSEYGGLNETFADVAALTGEDRYLKLAHQFSHQAILQPLLRNEDVLTGMHANTQIPKVIGFKRVADVEGNQAWDEASNFFWETVIKHRTITIGGNSVREHFHPANDFCSMLESEQGPETCNTYNMLRLTKMLYETRGDASYLDYYERALYNHILSTINPIQGGFVYFTPMRPGHYRVYSQPQTSFWCCVGSGLENHARYGEMIYGKKEKRVYVNLFIPSTLEWKEEEISIEQQNRFPEEAATEIVITEAKRATQFELYLRLPGWAKREELRLTINGQSAPLSVKEGYVAVNRTWRRGDCVRLEMPMHLRAEATPDGAAHYSFLYGPIVLAASLGKQDQIGLYADDSRGGHIANGPQLPAHQLPILVGERKTIVNHLTPVANKPLTFVLKGLSLSHFENIELVPFYELHECRYMVYFPLVTEDELKQKQAEWAIAEQARSVLNAMTVDKVVCGEQQPESDHFIAMENCHTGSENGVHWRETHRFFSYQLRRNNRLITHVQIDYLADKDRDAHLLVNGEFIGRIASSAWGRV